jgi:hypothetical protein
MDLTLPHQSVPTLGRPTPRLPSNENRSLLGPSASLHVLASVLPTQFGSINEYTVEVAQCPRTERQKSSLGDAGLECCGELYDR